MNLKILKNNRGFSPLIKALFILWISVAVMSVDSLEEESSTVTFEITASKLLPIKITHTLDGEEKTVIVTTLSWRREVTVSKNYTDDGKREKLYVMVEPEGLIYNMDQPPPISLEVALYIDGKLFDRRTNSHLRQPSTTLPFDIVPLHLLTYEVIGEKDSFVNVQYQVKLEDSIEPRWKTISSSFPWIVEYTFLGVPFQKEEERGLDLLLQAYASDDSEVTVNIYLDGKLFDTKTSTKSNPTAKIEKTLYPSQYQ